MSWFDNSITYYKWWITEVGFQYLTYDQQTSVLVHRIRNFRDPTWNVRAAKKALAFRTDHDRKESNHLARVIGRAGEETIVSYLEGKGWDIITRPSTELYPKFGTSTSGYDIVARHGKTQISIEVKSHQDSIPLWTLGPKCYESIKRAKTDYLAITRGEEVRFCAVKDLVFDEPVYMHDALKYSRERAFKHLLVINPACLHKISRKEVK